MKILLYISCISYILFITVLNILFIYITIVNYKEFSLEGLLKINIICEIIIDFILIVLTYTMTYIEFNYYINKKNKDIFKYIGEIKSKRTRLLFGLLQLFISCYYIKNNTNFINNITITKITFGIIYFIIGIINICISFFGKFKIKNKNRESM